MESVRQHFVLELSLVCYNNAVMNLSDIHFESMITVMTLTYRGLSKLIWAVLVTCNCCTPSAFC